MSSDLFFVETGLQQLKHNKRFEISVFGSLWNRYFSSWKRDGEVLPCQILHSNGFSHYIQMIYEGVEVHWFWIVWHHNGERWRTMQLFKSCTCFTQTQVGKIKIKSDNSKRTTSSCTKWWPPQWDKWRERHEHSAEMNSWY